MLSLRSPNVAYLPAKHIHKARRYHPNLSGVAGVVRTLLLNFLIPHFTERSTPFHYPHSLLQLQRLNL